MKRILSLVLITIGGSILGIIVVELTTPIIYRTVCHRSFNTSSILESLSLPIFSSQKDPSLVRATSGALLHPYTGYTLDPSVKGINELGFFGPVPHEDSDVFSVALLGGSLAFDFFETAKEKLLPRLSYLQKEKNKKLEIVNLAMGGYKQPQQLMALAYLLSIGKHFDLVINIDGFNEVVLPLMDNEPFHVSPSYPRIWYPLSQQTFSREQRLFLSRWNFCRVNIAHYITYGSTLDYFNIVHSFSL